MELTPAFSPAAAERPVPPCEVYAVVSTYYERLLDELNAFEQCSTESERNKRSYEDRTHASLAARYLQRPLVHGKRKSMDVILPILKEVVDYAATGEYSTEWMHARLMSTAENCYHDHTSGLPLLAKWAAQFIFLDLAAQLGAPRQLFCSRALARC